jgi:hypothetical protein
MFDLTSQRCSSSTALGSRVLVTTAYHARDDGQWKFEVDRTLDPVVRPTLRLAKCRGLHPWVTITDRPSDCDRLAYAAPQRVALDTCRLVRTASRLAPPA